MPRQDAARARQALRLGAGQRAPGRTDVLSGVAAFAAWLSQTSLSLAIQTHEWVIPTIQSIHIAAIGIALVSAFMIAFHVLGWTGSDQTLADTRQRFGPWLAASLVVLLMTGALMVLGEPARELLAFSFWLKMVLIVAGTLLIALVSRRGTKALGVLTLLVWVSIIFLGRLIAYDHIWGSWSPKAR
jgi:hypothetical protein